MLAIRSPSPLIVRGVCKYQLKPRLRPFSSITLTPPGRHQNPFPPGEFHRSRTLISKFERGVVGKACLWRRGISSFAGSTDTGMALTRSTDPLVWIDCEVSTSLLGSLLGHWKKQGNRHLYDCDAAVWRMRWTTLLSSASEGILNGFWHDGRRLCWSRNIVSLPMPLPQSPL
jgi:hypothetical protein